MLLFAIISLSVVSVFLIILTLLILIDPFEGTTKKHFIILFVTIIILTSINVPLIIKYKKVESKAHGTVIGVEHKEENIEKYYVDYTGARFDYFLFVASGEYQNFDKIITIHQINCYKLIVDYDNDIYIFYSIEPYEIGDKISKHDIIYESKLQKKNFIIKEVINLK